MLENTYHFLCSSFFGSPTAFKYITIIFYFLFPFCFVSERAQVSSLCLFNPDVIFWSLLSMRWDSRNTAKYVMVLQFQTILVFVSLSYPRLLCFFGALVVFRTGRLVTCLANPSSFPRLGSGASSYSATQPTEFLLKAELIKSSTTLKEIQNSLLYISSCVKIRINHKE